MKLPLVRIGNSRGIRLPKALIEQYGFGESVEVRAERDGLFITSARHPREGWAEAFAASGPSTNDELLLEGFSNKFDNDEWEW